MEGATDLNDLLGSAPIQQHPQSTTFSPIVTGGADPFIAPASSSKPIGISQSQSNMFSTIRYAVRNFMTYFAFFVAAVVISLSTPRSLILQYIPNTYTAGGVPSYMGAAVLGGVAVAIAYVLSNVLGSLI